MINLYNMDCMEAMEAAPDNYWDLAIVDPPYGLGMGKIKTYVVSSTKTVLTKYKPKNWDNQIPNKKYFDNLFRISKHQIIFGANYFVEYLTATKCWIVWDKKIGDNCFSMHELIYTSFNLPSKIVSLHFGSNRVSNNSEKAQKYIRIHPTQKPVALYTWLLSKYAKKGDKILDTHLGSGSSAIAAYNAGYEFHGYEIDTDYYNAAKKRFDNHKRQLRMFV